MQQLAKYSLSVQLIIFLCIVRFMIMPFIDWQSISLDEILSKREQVLKAEWLVANKHAYESIIENTQKNISNDDKLYVIGEQDKLKLDTQKTIEAILVKNKIEINNFGWKPCFSIYENQLNNCTSDLTIETDTYPLFSTIWLLDQNNSHLYLSSFNINFKKMSSESLGQARARLGYSFLYQETN